MIFPAIFVTSAEEETRAAGRALGAELRPGDVVGLTGVLGVGKTVFVRGIAEGLGGDPDGVASPTFALLHEYDCDDDAERDHREHDALVRAALVPGADTCGEARED